MNDRVDDENVENTDAETSEQPTKKPLPVWKKTLLGVAFGVGILGAALYLFSLTQAEEPPPPPVADSPQVSAQGMSSSFSPLQDNSVPLPSDSGAVGISGQDLLEAITMADWSSLLMKLGFSFVLGFAIGYALSGLLKVILLVTGLIALLLFGLQYGGLIEVNWHNFEPYYDAFMAWLQPHIGSFQDFITSNLPSSTSAAAGIFLGLRRF